MNTKVSRLNEKDTSVQRVFDLVEERSFDLTLDEDEDEERRRSRSRRNLCLRNSGVGDRFFVGEDRWTCRFLVDRSELEDLDDFEDEDDEDEEVDLLCRRLEFDDRLEVEQNSIFFYSDEEVKSIGLLSRPRP